MAGAKLKENILKRRLRKLVSAAKASTTRKIAKIQ